jgi:hypothetical protein
MKELTDLIRTSLYAVPRIAHALNRIANCLEASEQRSRRKEALGLPLSYEDHTLVDQARLVLEAFDQVGTKPTTPEDIGAALAAVRRGFAEMEETRKEQS